MRTLRCHRNRLASLARPAYSFPQDIMSGLDEAGKETAGTGAERYIATLYCGAKRESRGAAHRSMLEPGLCVEIQMAPLLALIRGVCKRLRACAWCLGWCVLRGSLCRRRKWREKRDRQTFLQTAASCQLPPATCHLPHTASLHHSSAVFVCAQYCIALSGRCLPVTDAAHSSATVPGLAIPL